MRWPQTMKLGPEQWHRQLIFCLLVLASHMGASAGSSYSTFDSALCLGKQWSPWEHAASWEIWKKLLVTGFGLQLHSHCSASLHISPSIYLKSSFQIKLNNLKNYKVYAQQKKQSRYQRGNIWDYGKYVQTLHPRRDKLPQIQKEP